MTARVVCGERPERSIGARALRCVALCCACLDSSPPRKYNMKTIDELCKVYRDTYEDASLTGVVDPLPCAVDAVAEAVAADWRERAEKAEREVERITNNLVQTEKHAQRLEARLARYEAPGPALLVAEHSVACEALRHAWKEEIAQYDPPGLGPTEPTCNDSGCHAAAADRAYREQHARCVAVVEPALTACLAWLAAVACSDCGEPKHKCFCDCGPRDKAIDLAVAALAALTGEVAP